MFSREQIREVDRRASEEFAVPGVVLMENAGRGCAELLLRLGIRGLVLICCGKGNNGGDGFVMARHLDNAGVPVRVWLFADPAELTGDAALQFNILQKAQLPLTVADSTTLPLSSADWVVDALLGTGLTGQVRSPLDSVIGAINASGANILSVDIPSGLDCDTGEPLGVAVQANHTATFVGPKKGFANPAAAQWLGKVHVLSIGAPREYQFLSAVK